MDEQRFQDYLSLIQELLSCPSEQQAEILQANLHLIDEGFVTVVKHIATQMAQGGNQNTANCLPDLTAAILNKVAVELHQRGEYGQALIFAERVFVVTRQLLGDSHPHVTISLNLLAFCYQSLGRYAEAEPLYLQALAMRSHLLGEADLAVAKILNNLGGVYQSQGRYSEAEPLLVQALAIRRELLGEAHTDVAQSLNNLAGLYDTRGRYAEAEPLYVEALAMRRELLGEAHPDVAQSLSNLTGLYLSLGRYAEYAEAEPLYKQALQIRCQSLGEAHPDVAQSFHNLAFFYQSLGRYSKAEPLLVRALALRRQLLGEVHTDVAQSLSNLAFLYDAQGRYSEAECLFVQALAMRRQLFGEVHPDVAQSLNNLAGAYSTQRRYAEAEPLFLQALTLRRQLLGEVHPDVVQNLNNLAVLLAATDRYSEALERMKEAAAIENRLISQAFAASSERDRLSFLQTIQGNFYAYLSLVSKHLHHSPQAVQAALDLVLQRKALSAAALAALNQGIYSGRYPHLTGELKKLRDLSDQIIHFTFTQSQPDRIPQLQKEHDQLQQQLARQVPEIQLQEQPVSCSSVALELPEGSTLIEFVCFDVADFHATSKESQWQPARYLAFILPAGQPDKVQMRDLGEAEPIDQLIQDFRHYASDGNLAVHSLDMGGDDDEPEDLRQFPAEASELREAIFKPLCPYLQKQQHLFIAPDGNLNLLQFKILPTDETGEQLLMDEYRISYLSVGRDILRSQVRVKRPASPPLIIADPDFDLVAANFDPPLPPLKRGENLTDERVGAGLVDNLEGKPRASQQNPPSYSSAAQLLQTLAGSTFARTQGTRVLGESVAKLLGVSPYIDKQALASHLTNCQSPEILLIATHGLFSREIQLQDYWNLTLALLVCPDGQEAKLLQKNRKLLDKTLLEVMEKAAAILAEDGKQNAADWLRNFAAQLAAIINESTQQTPIQNPPNSAYQGGNSKMLHPEDPMLRSALAFAGANAWLQGKTLPNEAGKGIVFAQDVAALDLWATELAVLSACNTAMGDIKLGEGVFGLRRAFAVAGAKTLVMSLWSVPDRATALLMQRFFTNLRQGLGRADALQDAQNYIRTITVKELQQSLLGRSVLDELVEKQLTPQELHLCQNNSPLEHPYFWGAWVCQGDTTPMKSWARGNHGRSFSEEIAPTELKS